MKYMNVIGAAALLIATSGCATTAGKPLTTEQRIARCGALVLGGGILGAVLGGEKGAAIGIGVGGAACGIWLAFDNEADKRRLAEAELEAVRSGQEVNRSWRGDDGRTRSVRVVPSTETMSLRPVDIEKNGDTPRVCREANVTPSLDGNSADTFVTYSCRNADGDWERVEQAMVPV